MHLSARLEISFTNLSLCVHVGLPSILVSGHLHTTLNAAFLACRMVAAVAVDLPVEDLPKLSNTKNVWLKNIGFLALGIVGLFYGAEWLLSSATNIALAFGVSPYIIGVTILAVGTSIPELTTSVIAAYKKETEIALGNLIGSNIFNILAVVGLVLIIVNLKGGMQAVIWLDVFQGFMLFASGIICLGILIYAIKGGVPEILKVATENNRAGFGPYDIGFTKLTLIVMIFNGAFYAIQKYGTDQTVVQRYLSAKSDKGAIKASLIGILLAVPVWAMFMFIGTCLFVFYKQNPLPEGTLSEAVFPYFMMTQLPTGVVGFIVAALISAAICSLSADLNSLAAVGIEDYYKKIKPNQEDKKYLLASKLMIVFSGALSVAIGYLYLYAGSEGVLGVIFTVYAIFSGGIVGIFLLGVFSARANRQGVNIAIIVCILFTGYAFLTSTAIGLPGHQKLLLDFGAFNFTHHKLMLGVYSHLIVIGVGYLASLFFLKPILNSNLLYNGWIVSRRLARKMKS